MKSFPSVGAFVDFLAVVTRGVAAAEHRGLDKAGALIEKEAKGMLGYEHEEWPDLAPSTVARKEAKGQTGRWSATDPLVATGELLASISHQIEGRAVIIGTPDEIGIYQEMGTDRIPPRPFLSATAMQHGEAAANLLGREVALTIAGKPA